MQKAYYSIMQYCPDRFRAEAVNLGLVMLCPEPHEVRVDLIRDYGRVRKLFGVRGEELKSLKRMARNLKHRIEFANGELHTDEDLASFAASRANDLRLTAPRLAKVGDLAMGFERLFEQLIEDRATDDVERMMSGEILPPTLEEIFEKLAANHKAWRPNRITVPVLNGVMDIPYAYRNGIVNLIKPKVFAASRKAETQAATLAVNGDLIRKHPVDGVQQQLIVVSSHETPEQAKEIDDHVQPLFNEYKVRLIRPNMAEDFAKEVEASAH